MIIINVYILVLEVYRIVVNIAFKEDVDKLPMQGMQTDYMF